MLSFHLRVRFPELAKVNEYNPERKVLEVEKFREGTIVSVGFSKVDQTESVPLLRTRLPMSERVADETPRPPVPDSQRMVPLPLTSWRLPEVRKRNDPPESTVAGWAPPARQMGTPP